MAKKHAVTLFSLALGVLSILTPTGNGQTRIDPKSWAGEPNDVIRIAASENQLAAQHSRDSAVAKIFSQNAVALWRLFLQRNPSAAEAAQATSGIGVCLERAEGPESAVRYCQTILAKQPNAFPELRFCLARLLQQRFKTSHARSDLDEVIRLLKDLHLPKLQPFINFMRADALASKEAYAEAVSQYRRLVDENVGDELAPQALYEMGRLLLVVNDPTGAAEAFRRFLRESHPKAEAHWKEPRLGRAVRLGLANALFAQECFAEAADYYDTLSNEAHPQKEFALLRHAECLAGLKVWPQAALKAEKLLDHAELGDRARYLAARWWLEAKEPEKARDVLKRGNRTFHDLTSDESKLEIHARLRQAEKWFQDQNWRQAARAFQEITELAENDEVKEFAHRQAGVSYYHLGRWDFAEKELTAQIQVAPTGPLAPYTRFLLGMIASRLAETAPPREVADLASKARVAFSDALTGARAARDHHLVLTILSQAAAVLEKHGQVRVAETYYQEILAENQASRKERLDAHESLARLCLKASEPRHAQAVVHLSTMLPGCAGVRAERVRFVLGQCYRALDQTDQALECFENLAGAAQTPDLAARASYEVGCCRERLGQSEKALDVWYDLITRYPAHERFREVEGKLQDALQRHLRNKKL